MVVGLTGGIGSGKTTVLKMFQQYNNVVVYIADVEAKRIMNSSEIIKSKLIKNFGEDTFKENQLNRKYIADIVFKSKEKLEILNAIVHPEVYKDLSRFIKENEDKSYVLYENAILFENKSDAFCDKIITVTAPKEIRIQRVVNRDITTKQTVENRINNQWLDAKKILQSNYIINNIDLDTTKDQVFKIHKKLTKK